MGEKENMRFIEIMAHIISLESVICEAFKIDRKEYDKLIEEMRKYIKKELG